MAIFGLYHAIIIRQGVNYAWPGDQNASLAKPRPSNSKASLQISAQPDKHVCRKVVKLGQNFGNNVDISTI